MSIRAKLWHGQALIPVSIGASAFFPSLMNPVNFADCVNAVRGGNRYE